MLRLFFKPFCPLTIVIDENQDLDSVGTISSEHSYAKLVKLDVYFHQPGSKDDIKGILANL